MNFSDAGDGEPGQERSVWGSRQDYHKGHPIPRRSKDQRVYWELYLYKVVEGSRRRRGMMVRKKKFDGCRSCTSF